MKRILGSTVAVAALALAIAGTANASAGSESITTTFQVLSLPTAPPYTETYPGTYTATGTFDDAGSVTSQTLFSAVPSPTVGGLQTLRTYTSDQGHGMLVLRCSQLRTATASRGTCAVISATGDFSTLSRSGTISNFNPAPPTPSDTVVLGR